MEFCTVYGCQKPVSRAGHKLCYEHWKANNSVSKALNCPSKEELQTKAALLSATKLSEKLDVSVRKINPILAELGLLDKVANGWVVTKRGLAFGAEQKVDTAKDNQYVVWSEEILINQAFLQIFQGLATDSSQAGAQEDNSHNSFREKFRSNAKYRTEDGHWVRSKAEMLIDNWLYWAELVHAYERKLPLPESAYCDFYVRTGRVYIEYWGLESEPRYAARMQEKKKLYEQYGLNLIELTDQHIKNLDDHLPQMLRKFGVAVS